MGKSFYYTQSYSQLCNASQVFSDLINAAAVSYGLTVAQAADYKTLHDDYKAKFMLTEAPATRTSVTLIDRNNSASALRVKAAELARIVEATPTVTDGQRESLGLSVRKTPEPMGPPGTPYDFKVTLKGDGSIEFGFKSNNPTGSQGTMYQIFRRLGSSGAFEYLGGVGDRKYHDTTIPAGTASVTYKIQAVRSTAVGDWAEFSVGFGSAANGALTASVTQTEPKLAA